MKKGLIFLNGNPPDNKTLASIDYKDKTIVCADGAYDYLKDFIVPDVLLGDFDSIKAVPNNVEIKKFPVDKDYTDGHLSILEMAERGVEYMEIYGAFGGRPDHEYANFALLALAESLNIKAVIKGDYDIFFVSKEIKLKTEKGKTVSLVPYSDKAHILVTEGLKFDASLLTLNKLHLIGMSNTAINEEIYISVGAGCILVFVQRR